MKSPGPPPPTLGTPLSTATTTTKVLVSKKNVPQSSNPLKSFNWSKLPDCKVECHSARGGLKIE